MRVVYKVSVFGYTLAMGMLALASGSILYGVTHPPSYDLGHLPKLYTKLDGRDLLIPQARAIVIKNFKPEDHLAKR